MHKHLLGKLGLPNVRKGTFLVVTDWTGTPPTMKDVITRRLTDTKMMVAVPVVEQVLGTDLEEYLTGEIDPQARIEAITKIAETAREHGLPAQLVTGKIFQGEGIEGFTWDPVTVVPHNVIAEDLVPIADKDSWQGFNFSQPVHKATSIVESHDNAMQVLETLGYAPMATA